MGTKKRLPDKLSELLRLAVADAQAIEKTPGYKLDMGMWHAVDHDGICHVCMAGAVMASSLGAPRENTNPWSIAEDDDETANKLDLIDDMRTGYFHGLVPPDVETQLLFVGREYDAAGDADRCHWGTYLRAADILERAGL